jgi:spore coat protein CotH
MRFPFTRQEFLWLIIIVMLGVNMFWTASLIQPIIQITDNQRRLAEIAIAQNLRIFEQTERIIILLNTTD